MPVSKAFLFDQLEKSFPNSEIELQDLKGDQNHYRLYLKSESFSGKTPVQQHQMVYAALGNIVGHELHALELNTEEK